MMPSQITLGVYRRLDNRLEGLSDDSARALELHNRRRDVLHEIFDTVRGAEVLDWGLTDDTQPHEYVELAIAAGSVVFHYAVVPGLKSLGEKLAEKALDTAVDEFVQAVVSWFRPAQESKKILDFVISLPDGSRIMVDPPDRNATITIHFADGQVDSVTYAHDQVPAIPNATPLSS